MRLLFLFLFCVCTLEAASASTFVLSTRKPASDQCTPPPSSTSFLTTDSKIYEYFELDVTKGDNVSVSWISPDRHLVNTTWPTITSAGTFCFTGGYLDLSGLQNTRLGSWTATVFVNNGSVSPDLTFTITAPGTHTNNSYQGSLDGADCDHIFGWARDTNNPNNTVSVNLSIDANYFTTVQAGDARSDLTNAGIGPHAFNYYGLPASLKDGAQHQIIARTSDGQQLPGSLKFQNFCQTISAPPFPTWTYTSGLDGNVVVLAKKPITASSPNGTFYQYSVFVIGTGGVGVKSAHLTVVSNKEAYVDHNSYRRDLRYGYAQDIRASLYDDSQWLSAPSIDNSGHTLPPGVSLALDLIGLFVPELSIPIGSISSTNDFFALIPAVNITPSEALATKMEQDNTFTTRRFLASMSTNVVPSALRFVFNTTEPQQAEPDIFIRFGFYALEIPAVDRNHPIVQSKYF